jgi:hypothetical protein
LRLSHIVFRRLERNYPGNAIDLGVEPVSTALTASFQWGLRQVPHRPSRQQGHTCEADGAERGKTVRDAEIDHVDASLAPSVASASAT